MSEIFIIVTLSMRLAKVSYDDNRTVRTLQTQTLPTRPAQLCRPIVLIEPRQLDCGDCEDFSYAAHVPAIHAQSEARLALETSPFVPTPVLKFFKSEIGLSDIAVKREINVALVNVIDEKAAMVGENFAGVRSRRL